MQDTQNTSLGETHKVLLEQLDKAYGEIRKVHEEITWCNQNSAYAQTIDSFNLVQKTIWKFKELYVELINIKAE